MSVSSWWGGGKGKGGREKDTERLFVWLSTLCERGGGEEKRAGNTLESGFVSAVAFVDHINSHAMRRGRTRPPEPPGLTMAALHFIESAVINFALKPIWKD